MFKKLLSLLLAAVVTVSVLTAAPISASAAAVDPSSRTGQKVAVTGEGSVGELLSGALNGSQESDGDCANGITDVTVEGRETTVTLNNEASCMIVVGLYDDSGEHLQMTAIQRDIAPNAGQITLGFEDDPPETFYLRAFILDENCSPLHCQYESERYTAEYQAFLERETGDFADDDVLNFDEDPTNNFAVLHEGVERIDTAAHNILSAQSGRSYTFTDIDDSLRGLQSGDIFCFERGDKPEIIKAESVTVSGDTAVVTADKTLSMEDAFSYVKIDTSLISGSPEMDMSGADEGVALDDPGFAPTGASYDISEKEEFSFRFTLDGGETASASGGLTIAAGYHVHLYYTEKIFETSLSVETETTLDITLTDEFKGEKQLGRAILPTPVAGLAVGIGFSLILEASAQITSQVKLTSMVGFSYNKNTGFNLISEKPSANAEVTVEGTFFVGIGLSPSVYVLYGAVTLGLPVTVGTEINAKSVVTTTDSEESAHQCHSCIDGTVSVLCTVSGEVDVLMMWDKKIDFGEIRWELFEYYFSSERGWGLGKCPNLGIPRANGEDRPFEPELGNLPDTGTCTIEWSSGSSVMTITGSGRLNEDTIRAAAEQYENRLLNTYGVTDVYNSDTHEWKHYYSPVISPQKRLNNDLFANLWRIKTLNIDGFTTIDESIFKGYFKELFAASYYVRNENEANAYSREIDALQDTLDQSVYEGLFNVTTLNITGPTVFIDNGTFSQYTNRPGYDRYYFENLTTVTLPDSLLWIGDGAFSRSMISEITLPSSLGYMGVYVFKHAEHVIVPAGVESLYAKRSLSGGCDQLTILTDGEVCFSDCKIKSVSLQNHATKICDYFMDGSDIGILTVPDTVEEIGDHAFEGCNYLKTVNLPQSLKKIGGYAFYCCSELEYINYIPSSLSEIEIYAFAGTALRRVCIPGSVAVIGVGAFSSCKRLNELEIEEGVKSIAPHAFSYCDNLESVTLPRSLTELHANAFYKEIYPDEYTSYSAPGLKSVYYNGTLREWNRIIAGYDFVGESWINLYEFSESFIREHYGEELVDNAKLKDLIIFCPWNYMPENYRAYTMGERLINFTWNSFPVYCTGGKNVSKPEPVPTGSLAATGSVPETLCPNTEYLIAVENDDNGCLRGAIRYLTQVKADENGELHYELPDGAINEGDHLNIYGACGHPSAHFEDGGYGGKQIYICDVCGQPVPSVIDISRQSEPSEPYLSGDVDGDGLVTLIDASLIQCRLANLSANGGFDEKAADVDDNGVVEVIDATWIQRFAVELEIPYPIGETIYD